MFTLYANVPRCVMLFLHPFTSRSSALCFSRLYSDFFFFSSCVLVVAACLFASSFPISSINSFFGLASFFFFRPKGMMCLVDSLAVPVSSHCLIVLKSLSTLIPFYVSARRNNTLVWLTLATFVFLVCWLTMSGEKASSGTPRILRCGAAALCAMGSPRIRKHHQKWRVETMPGR